MGATPLPVLSLLVFVRLFCALGALVIIVGPSFVLRVVRLFVGWSVVARFARFAWFAWFAWFARFARC